MTRINPVGDWRGGASDHVETVPDTFYLPALQEFPRVAFHERRALPGHYLEFPF